MSLILWLTKSMRKLADAGVDSPRRDSFVLVEDLLEKDRSWVNAHADFELSAEQTITLDQQIARRVKREPLAYIRGKAWFYGRFFQVTRDVMVPRPESESFIELLKQLKPKKVFDIGTGSGCLAITAKLELPEAEISAIDIDEKALKISKINSKQHGVYVRFVQGSLLKPIKNKDFTQSAIIANLPYVPDGLITSEEINYEPKTALFSGKDGMDHYRKFWKEVSGLDKKPEHILTESLQDQHKQMVHLATDAGYELSKTDVLVQQFERI